MKRVISIILTVVCVFSLTTVGFAAEAADVSGEAIFQNTVDVIADVIETTVDTLSDTEDIEQGVLEVVEPELVDEPETDVEPVETVRSSQVKAPSASLGYDALLNYWTVTEGENDMTYAYYSPVINEEDNVKYPLVIYVHGLFHGWTKKSFVKNGLVYWMSSEMQDKFAEGGAHLLAPRIPELVPTAAQSGDVMGVIKEYVAENADSIDTNQIYLMGGSAGGGLAWKLLIENPDYFTKGMLLCATGTVSASEAQRVANIPIWAVSARTDPLVWYPLQNTTWNNVSRYSNVKDQCRRTTFNNHVTLPEGNRPGISHFLAKTIGYNFCTISDKQLYSDITTVDANGDIINLTWDNSIVEWFQS